ncbi:hypothetical protein ACL02S_06100 [Nocardia sp. 004]|uniref:Rv0361 family membrane protein n=1 Tax=Nocardia sp. 004 TaxID=3385978 RepID=UPI0039A0EA83
MSDQKDEKNPVRDTAEPDGATGPDTTAEGTSAAEKNAPRPAAPPTQPIAHTAQRSGDARRPTGTAPHQADKSDAGASAPTAGSAPTGSSAPTPKKNAPAATPEPTTGPSSNPKAPGPGSAAGEPTTPQGPTAKTSEGTPRPPAPGSAAAVGNSGTPARDSKPKPTTPPQPIPPHTAPPRTTPPQAVPRSPGDTAGAEAETAAISRNDPGQDAATVEIRKQRPPEEPQNQEAQTVALPTQPPSDRRAGSNHVVTPPPGPPPITKPPNTPRAAPGPQRSGPQGPAAARQRAPQAKQNRPPHPAPGRPHEAATAASPADTKHTVPAQSLAGPRRPPRPRPIAQPQHIPPQPGDAAAATAPTGPKRWLLAVGAAATLLVFLITIVVVLVTRTDDNSPEAQVRTAITDYTAALETGDLAGLRETTCGPLHDFYQGIPDDQFASVHQLSAERKNIPVVDSIDAIRITDDTAIAQATVYTEADPAKRSARTFDLQRTDTGWKVCDPPSST